MSRSFDAVTWEATFRVWLARFVDGDHPALRKVWVRAPLYVRVRQAERWLRRPIAAGRRLR